MLKTSFFSWLLNFIVRASIGIICIYFLNEYLAMEGIALQVGVNAITFLTSGSLGLPGVAMLYGMVFYQML